MRWGFLKPDGPAPEAHEDRAARSGAALPRPIRAFHDACDHERRKLGRERDRLKMFIPVFRVRRDDLF
jgi:hypothetical protein